MAPETEHATDPRCDTELPARTVFSRPARPLPGPARRGRLPRRTATGLRQLFQAIRRLINPYREPARAAEAAGDTEGREQVSVRMCGFPFRP
ncbi:hypothetical protein ACQPZG_25860 [Streptomyces sp. CA-294286]|uniref:hypothetical protein n=1 Tax=Streptomyces sp. CA-294286 TaxID=3240070 RepID=UPI003D90B5CA